MQTRALRDEESLFFSYSSDECAEYLKNIHSRPFMACAYNHFSINISQRS